MKLTTKYIKEQIVNDWLHKEPLSEIKNHNGLPDNINPHLKASNWKRVRKLTFDFKSDVGESWGNEVTFYTPNHPDLYWELYEGSLDVLIINMTLDDSLLNKKFTYREFISSTEDAIIGVISNNEDTEILAVTFTVD